MKRLKYKTTQQYKLINSIFAEINYSMCTDQDLWEVLFVIAVKHYIDSHTFYIRSTPIGGHTKKTYA